MARWRGREALFALGEEPPEHVDTRLQRTMIAYACVTMVYRAILYIGIALLVYHCVFKALGILLFCVEVFVFLVRPVLSEAREWHARRHRIMASPRARIAGLCVGVALIALFLPLDRSVTVPAVLSPIADKPIVSVDPARVESVLVRDGAEVKAGQPLLVLSSPDIDLGISQAKLRIAQIESQLARGAADREDLADTAVLQRDLAAQHDNLMGLQRRHAALTVRAAFAGRVVDLQRDLAPGTWTDGRAPLLRLVTPGRYSVNAYVREDDRWRLTAGSLGTFRSSGALPDEWHVRLDEIGASAVGRLDQPMLADTNGGPIEVHRASTAKDMKDGLKPTHAMASLRLTAQQTQQSGYPQTVAGTVILPATGESAMSRIMRSLMRVLVRETSIT